MVVDRVHRRHDAQEHPAGPEAGADGAERPVDHADVGHDQRVDRDRHVELARVVVEVVHRTGLEGHLARPSAPSRSRACAIMRGGEVERDHPAEPPGQKRSKSGPVPHPRSATVRRSGSGTASSAVQQRVLDARMEGVEEQLIIPRRVTAPLAVLILEACARAGGLFRQRSVSGPCSGRPICVSHPGRRASGRSLTADR